jgi:hypothetical protein
MREYLPLIFCRLCPNFFHSLPLLRATLVTSIIGPIIYDYTTHINFVTSICIPEKKYPVIVEAAETLLSRKILALLALESGRSRDMRHALKLILLEHSQ